ncbi:hypothetical protein QUW49_01415 [Lacrimispora saccharolytica]|nr:hypothetical protein [Lacrimispora saccharolytica]
MRKAKAASILLFVISLVLFLYCIFVREGGQDQSGPQIQIDQQEIQVSIAAGEEELLQGITATDRKDGDVTESLAVESRSNFIEKGRRKISIVAFDSDNHVARAEREIVYTDYTSPVFSLDSPLRFSTEAENLLTGLHAQDCLDGDISNKIQVSFQDNLYSLTPGQYQATYSVANSAGDVKNLPVTVEIYDAAQEIQPPTLTLSQYLINLSVGEGFDPWGYLDSVTINRSQYVKGEDGILRNGMNEEEILDSSAIQIENPVDTNTPGVYEVIYSVYDEDGVQGTVRLIVSVNG